MQDVHRALPQYDWRYGRHMHGSHARRILKELSTLRDQCLLYFVPKVHRKLAETIRVMTVRAYNDPAVINMQRVSAFRTLINVHRIEKHVKIEVNKVCAAVWRQFALWLAQLRDEPTPDYSSKLRAIRTHQASTTQMVLCAMRSVARWLIFYLTATQLSVREHCWKARSAAEMHERFIEVYVQSRRLMRTLVDVLHSEAVVLNDVVAATPLP